MRFSRDQGKPLAAGREGTQQATASIYGSLDENRLPSAIQAQTKQVLCGMVNGRCVNRQGWGGGASLKLSYRVADTASGRWNTLSG